MAKKLIVGILGLGVVVAGIAGFAAFTAQIVNLEAHVEKEIEFAAVKDCTTNPKTGDIECTETTGDFGTVIPQAEYNKRVELTLSKSFVDNVNQPKFGDVHFDLLWECKQDGTKDKWDNSKTNAEGKYTDLLVDKFPDCRDNLPHTDVTHPKNELDANLRDFVSQISSNAPGRCEIAFPFFPGDPGPPILPPSPHLGHPQSVKPPEKEVTAIFHGVLNDDGTDLSRKCIYTIKLLVPPCEGEFNPFTDPNGPSVKTIDCHFDKPSLDPQTWEHFADIGDDFKVQVVFHSLR